LRPHYSSGLALGLALGFIGSSFIYWLLDGTSSVVQSYISLMVPPIVTLIAAGLALWGISTQLQSNVELADKARLAKLDAARSSLPIVVSNIVKLCEERFYALAEGKLAQPAGTHGEISGFELSTLKDCIEHANGAEKAAMQQIIRVYQVLISRL
jgi:hypothetical protein